MGKKTHVNLMLFPCVESVPVVSEFFDTLISLIVCRGGYNLPRISGTIPAEYGMLTKLALL